jgi:hypothetical protein
MLSRKFVCGFQNNTTQFPNHEICFQNSQCVVSRQHAGLYVESKLQGYVDLRFACFYLIGQLESILRKFQLTGVVLVVLKPHVFNLTRQLVLKPPKFPTLAATHLDKLEEVLKRLCDAGLKVNADKSTFCALEIEYLGYVLS